MEKQRENRMRIGGDSHTEHKTTNNFMRNTEKSGTRGYGEFSHRPTQKYADRAC